MGLQQSCYLGVRVAAEFAHQQRRALAFGQLANALEHDRQLGFSSLLLRRDLRELAVTGQCPLAAPAGDVDCAVAGDAREPRPHLLRRVSTERDRQR